jgi:hypothetical protein
MIPPFSPTPSQDVLKNLPLFALLEENLVRIRRGDLLHPVNP